MRSKSLFTRLLIVTVALFLGITLVISFFSGWMFYDALRFEYRSKAAAISKSIAESSVDLVINANAETLQAQLNDYLHIKGVHYLVVRNAQGDVLAHTFVPVFPEVLQMGSTLNQSFTREFYLDHYHILRDQSLILNGLLGSVEVGMDLTPLHRLAVVRFLQMAVVILVIMGISVFLLYWLSKRFSRPVVALTHYANALARRNFEPLPEAIHQLESVIQSQDNEVGVLAHSFLNLEHTLGQYIDDLKKTTADKQRIESELNIARSIQMSFLPKLTAFQDESLSFKVDAYLESAKEVGGDFYDCFFIHDNKTVCLVVGDVSGKGVPAALVMAMTTTLLRSAAESNTCPAALLNWVNTHLCARNEWGMFVTVFVGFLDVASGQLSYVLAGHPGPIVRHPDGQLNVFSHSGDPVIGVVDLVTFRRFEYLLQTGDMLLVFTDGLTEAQNSAQELFGEDRVQSVVARDSGDLPKTLIDRLVGAIQTFSDNGNLYDDLTILALKWHSKPMSLGHEVRVKFRNDVSEISKLHQVVELFSQDNNLSAEVCQHLNLALEELISNIIFYGYEDHDEHIIYLFLEFKNNVVKAVVEDDGIPFNPLEAPEVDLADSLEEVSVGGLGIHVVRSITDELHYDRKDYKNILTIIKKLPQV